MKNDFFAQFEDGMGCVVIDLSDLIAKIQCLAIQLEMLEPDMWWDDKRRSVRLCHPNVVNWMAHYGLENFWDFPPGAITAMASSLEKRLEVLERGLPHAS